MTRECDIAERTSEQLFRRRPGFDKGPTTAAPTVTDWIQLVRGEYLEMPELRLTKSQVRRLWNLDAATCDALLESLIASQFLRRTPSGLYVRAESGGH